jgi:predicted metal-dependent hydrolase
VARSLHPPLEDIGWFQAVLGTRRVSYRLRRSLRARSARLEIRHATGLVVVIPKFYRVRDVTALLEKKRRWILGHLDRPRELPVPPRELKGGDCTPFLGTNLRIVVSTNGTTAPSMVRDGDTLVVNQRPGDGTLAAAVESWYRERADTVIRQRVETMAAVMGVNYRQLKVRTATTRWGSCSPRGNLSLNWKLVKLPEPVIDYVVVHELAHLREMNHSRAFWDLVAKYCPGYQDHRRCLRQHAGILAL